MLGYSVEKRQVGRNPLWSGHSFRLNIARIV